MLFVLCSDAIFSLNTLNGHSLQYQKLFIVFKSQYNLSRTFSITLHAIHQKGWQNSHELHCRSPSSTNELKLIIVLAGAALSTKILATNKSYQPSHLSSDFQA